MSLRLEYWAIVPQEFNAIMAVLQKLVRGLPPLLSDLVLLRVSQINGCPYCIDKHATSALQAGESAQRVNALPVWSEGSLFSERERTALAWAERLTRLNGAQPPDESYEALRTHFTDSEIVRLSLAVSLMNSLNRMSVAFGRKPASGSA